MTDIAAFDDIQLVAQAMCFEAITGYLRPNQAATRCQPEAGRADLAAARAALFDPDA